MARHENLGSYAKPKWKHSSTSRTYQRWAAMKQRTTSDLKAYEHVTCSPDWLNDFNKFVEDMGKCPKGYSLDREDNTLGYTKENCRWIPRNKQNKNRRYCIMVGDLTLKEFSRTVNIPYGTMYHRVKNMGMTPKEASIWQKH